jgi:hypothetical protein
MGFAPQTTNKFQMHSKILADSYTKESLPLLGVGQFQHNLHVNTTFHSAIPVLKKTNTICEDNVKLMRGEIFEWTLCCTPSFGELRGGTSNNMRRTNDVFT